MHIRPEIARPCRSRQAARKASISCGATPAFCGSAPILTSAKRRGRRPWRAISLASAAARLSRSTEWMASNRATASLALLDCNGPTRCSSRPPWRARSGGHFSFASCTRFSPKIRCPAPMTGSTASGAYVFATATKVTLSASRPASRQARAISARTASIPAGRIIVSISLRASRRLKLYRWREHPLYASHATLRAKTGGSNAERPNNAGRRIGAKVAASSADPQHPRPIDRPRPPRHRSAHARTCAQPRARPRRAGRTGALAVSRSGAQREAAQREIIDSERTLLRVFARTHERMPLDAPDCNRSLAELTANVPWIGGLGVAGTCGRLTCATDPRAIGLSISDRPYFQDALRSHEFVLSDYLINRVQHAPGLMAAFPITHEDGSLRGVVLASIRVEWIAEFARTVARRPGTSVLVIDGSGTLIGGSPDAGEFVGKNFANHALTRETLRNDEGATTVAGFDGVRRIFGHVRVPGTRARLAVGLDESVVHSGIDREISIAYVQLALFGMLVLLIAWFGGERLIVRPIRALVLTAARFGRGDLHVRAGDEPWLAEFQPLAAALDDMAHKLAGREEELRVANQHL